MHSRRPVPQSAGQLIVVRFVDGWRIIHSGRRWGRFEFQVDAVEAALRLARQGRVCGAETEIYVQSWAGEVSKLQIA